jgi:hypothetical protein
MTSYIEQYDRMKRWYGKFAELEQGRLHDVQSENYVDDIYAFFQNACHLKDWLINDVALSVPVRQAVEPYINSDRSLRLCADICNALKHLVLKSHRSGENPQFGKKQYNLNITPGGPTTISLEYEINTNSGPVDAFKLATDCVNAWDNFRAQHSV